jgi:hypothetical protein
MSFKVNQQVICVTSHSQGVVKVGETFKVIAIKNAVCCKIELLDVGIKPTSQTVICDCGVVSKVLDPRLWVAARLFMPVNGEVQQIVKEETKVYGS